MYHIIYNVNHLWWIFTWLKAQNIKRLKADIINGAGERKNERKRNKIYIPQISILMSMYTSEIKITGMVIKYSSTDYPFNVCKK